MSTKTKEKKQTLPTEKHPGVELLNEYAYNYPFDFGSEWIPIEICFEKLNTDERVVYYLLRVADLMNGSQFDEKFQRFGLIRDFSVIEKDPTTGYVGIEKMTLVSKHGVRYFEEFLKL